MLFSTAIVAFFAAATVSAAPTLSSRQARACFLTGSAVLPTDVIVDTTVKCDASVQPFKGVPNTISANGAVKYSDVDFQKEAGSPVAFAVKKFGAITDIAEVDAINQVYNAQNAGLRSLGAAAPAGALGRLKGVSFFLGMQQAIVNKNTDARSGILRNLGKTLKNCAGCSKADRQAVINLAKAAGQNTAEFTA